MSEDKTEIEAEWERIEAKCIARAAKAPKESRALLLSCHAAVLATARAMIKFQTATSACNCGRAHDVISPQDACDIAAQFLSDVSRL